MFNIDHLKTSKYLELRKCESDILLVFLHGGPGLSYEYFLPLFDCLEGSYNLLTYRQGMLIDKNNTDIKDLVAELKCVIDYLSYKKIIVIAHSFGSVIASEFINNYPVDGLILLNWIYDNHWLNIFNEKKYDLSQVNQIYDNLIKIVTNKNKNECENEKLKIRMVSFSQFYFDFNQVNNGKKMLESLTYNSEILSSLERKWENQVNVIENLKKCKLQKYSLISRTDRITHEEYYNTDLLNELKIVNIVTPEGGHFMCYTNPLLISNNIRDILNKIYNGGIYQGLRI